MDSVEIMVFISAWCLSVGFGFLLADMSTRLGIGGGIQTAIMVIAAVIIAIPVWMWIVRRRKKIER